MRGPHRLIAIVTLMLGLSSRLLAGISAPRSSVTFSADGTKVLVMVSPSLGEDTRPTVVFPDGRLIDIRKSFPRSGVYWVNDFKPDWQVAWFALDWDIRCSENLRYVVLLNRYAYPNKQALAFFDRGKLIKTWNCQDLLRSFTSRPFLDYSTWDWHWRWYEQFKTADDGRTLKLSTVRRKVLGYQFDVGLQELYTFDMATGAMTNRSTRWPWAMIGDLSALLVAGILACLAMRWAWRRWRQSIQCRGFDVLITTHPD